MASKNGKGQAGTSHTCALPWAPGEILVQMKILREFGDLLRKASHKDDPGNAAPGRRQDHGVNFLANCRGPQL